jgi:EAL domain-containing protein (putative c-di-GMP-specific phosphodiesterase class I)
MARPSPGQHWLSRAVVCAANVTSLAHALGLVAVAVAVAEGVETAGQLASARELGCDHAQGYLFARPAPADEIAHLLAARGSAEEPFERDRAVTAIRP